jgi:arylsulfatase A-like enzyme
MPSLSSTFAGLLAASVFASVPVSAADIVAGDVTATLGPDFFLDLASTGGGDNNATTFTRDIGGYWTPRAEVVITGLGWASGAGGTTSTSVTATFSEPGPDGAFGTADDVVVGSVIDDLVYSGASEYLWNFDSHVAFTATGNQLRVRIVSAASIRRKTTNDGTAQANVKLSIAGTATGGTPPPVVNTATASGNWDDIAWDTGSGTVSGGVGDDDSVRIGQYRKVTYRGLPAAETLADITLGATTPGQATLVVQSGTLTATGHLVAGRDASANDAFVEVLGGALHVNGNADFGRISEGADGSLIIAGGTVEIGGNLALGGFLQGGSMLRFHNPGTSPPVAVGGKLTLGRCALGLTFDDSYIHVPGTITTLVTYASRDGQFSNFRRGEEFNGGPNRFRIDYDSGGNAITLTALPNWPASNARPNIILIFADDGGYADLGMQGNPKFPTPRLSAMAAAGARFTAAYMSGAVCHPSRCGLLTGRYQQRFGNDNNLSGPGYNGLAISQRTLPQRLQGLHYRTYGIGKWHLGNTVEYHPNCRGFDRWYGMWAGSRSYYNTNSEEFVFQDQMTPRFEDEVPGTYVTDRIGDATVAFIDEHLNSSRAEDPFYIYVSLTAVHAPMDIQASDPRFARLENEFGLDASDYLNSSPVFAGSNQATVDANRYELAAMTLALDENIGKILDKLDAEELTGDTLVFFTNDNGGAGWVSGFGGNFSYNTPLRGYKGGTMTDGAIRVPAAVQWPGVIPAGQTVTTPVISLDLAATFVNAAGDAPAAARNGLDGLDLMPLLAHGTPLPAERVLTWRAGGLDAGSSAIRMGDWKMLVTGAAQTTTLYNIAANPAENDNLAASQPAILAELKRRYAAWEAATIAPFYGAASTVLDSGLERQAISGGYRLKQASPALAWLSSPFRTPPPAGADFHYRFLARPTETHLSSSARLAYGLGDSDSRAGLIQAILDFGQNQLRLLDGKSRATASAPLAAPTTDFTEASLDFKSTTNTLTFTFGSTTVSLPLTGNHGPLTHFAVGTAAMEGEITSLVPGAARSIAQSATVAGRLDGASFGMDLSFPGMPPFDPIPLSSADLTSFQPDPSILVENLGGGLYRATAPAVAGTPTRFFRFDLNQP